MARNDWKSGGGFGGFYFLGMVGSAVYFVQHAVGFGAGLLGLLKALVWPAFLIYQAFVLMHV